MFSPAIHSCSSYFASQPIQSSSSENEEINAIEPNELHNSQAAPRLPPELIEEIFNFLVTPYEPIKSILNLYATQRVNQHP